MGLWTIIAEVASKNEPHERSGNQTIAGGTMLHLSAGDSLVMERAVRMQRLQGWVVRERTELGSLNTGDSRGITFWIRMTQFLVTDQGQVFELHGENLNELVPTKLSEQIQSYTRPGR